TPAPTLPPPRPNWNPNAGRWSLDQGWDMVITETENRDLLPEQGPYGPEEVGEEQLQDLFPDVDLDPDAGFGDSGSDPSSRRTRNSCERDLPSGDPSFYYAPMTRFGPGPNDCRATGAVGVIDSFDIRPWRLDPKWKPAGYERLPVKNRAALHLIGNQLGGADGTLRNFVAGYQNPANHPHMSALESEIRAAAESGETVMYAVVPIYREDPAIPEEIRMRAIGSGGFELACVVYNRPTGGYDCEDG
ncbi:DNA/RNA non-specific endonuclease, partial [Streptomyces sp. URMC 129]|uniref:DNA/RNA non-specific endonuclease n=1 Tax=Streptomyces sp. URMC 129 TaxID=3423407 RepID=UPI003F19CFE0